MNIRKLAMSILVGIAAVPAMATAAHAGPDYVNPSPPTKDVVFESGQADQLRLVLFQNVDGSGHVIRYLGSNNCDDTGLDYQQRWINSEGGNWNDNVSASRNYANCDHRLYWSADFEGDYTGWRGNTTREYVGDTWNDRASSFKVS